MRKWIVLGAILLAMAGAVALALANLNSYLNRNKDWLADQIATALGRKVSFTEIGVQLFGGFGARIKDLRIADDPGFSREDFVKAGEVQISMALWPALFGRYEVKRVALVKPEVSIIRAQEGFNYDSIGKGKGAEPPKGAPTAERPPRSAKPPGGRREGPRRPRSSSPSSTSRRARSTSSIAPRARRATCDSAPSISPPPT